MNTDTTSHVHQETFEVAPENLFDLLITPSAIRSWWGAASAIVHPVEGGMWGATWGASEDEPEYITYATMSVFERPSRLVLTDYKYYSRSAPAIGDYTTEFLITPGADGTRLRVTQDGFPLSPEGREFLAACEVGWQQTFDGIRRYLDSVSNR